MLAAVRAWSVFAPTVVSCCGHLLRAQHHARSPTAGRRRPGGGTRWTAFPALRSDWASASTLNRYGGFAALKQEAAEANAKARRDHGTDVPDDVLARPMAITAERDAIYAAGTVTQPEPVPFPEALKAVLAGPHVKHERPGSRTPTALNPAT